MHNDHGGRRGKRVDVDADAAATDANANGGSARISVTDPASEDWQPGIVIVKEGDVVLGLPSSGVHSNGYSLVRKICFDLKGFKGDEYIEELGKTIGEELLTPTRLYPKSCLPLIENFDIHGMVHITGGGFYENIPRALPEDMAVEIDSSVWQMPAIFRLLQQWGNVDWKEMYRTFNMGIGMIIIASADEAEKIKAHLAAADETVYEIGRVVKGNHDVTIKGGVFHD